MVNLLKKSIVSDTQKKFFIGGDGGVEPTSEKTFISLSPSTVNFKIPNKL